MKAVITHRRPMGAITITINEINGGVELTRQMVGLFAPPVSSLKVDVPFNKAVEDLDNWAKGAVIQDACSDWEITWREWLITGILPGNPFNPVPH